MKIAGLSLLFVVAAGILFLSCNKNKNKPVPNAADMSVAGSGTFLPNGNASITVSAPFLADGSYTIYYTSDPYYLEDSMMSLTYKYIYIHSTLVMSNHTGTFLAGPLGTPNYTTIYLDSIMNKDGGVTADVGIAISLSDSTGMMKMQMNGIDTFTTVSTVMSRKQGLINVFAFLPSAGPVTNRAVQLAMDPTIVDIGVHNINTSDSGALCTGSYQSFNGSVITNKNFVSGSITIATKTPLFTGSFSVTCDDSTKMTGTFSCPAL